MERAGDAVSASGGDLRYIEPWRIDEGDLEPVQFRWSPRQAGPAKQAGQRLSSSAGSAARRRISRR